MDLLSGAAEGERDDDTGCKQIVVEVSYPGKESLCGLETANCQTLVKRDIGEKINVR